MLCNFRNSKNLRNHLDKRTNHIQLIFPYLDYNFNFKSDEKNEILKFESMTRMKEINIAVGMVIPNYQLVDKNIGLREFLKREQDESEFPLFFVFTLMRNSDYDFKKIKIFDAQIDLEFFKFKIIFLREDNLCDELLSDAYYVQIEELKKYDVLVIRPDFIIEYIS
jgi:hypothetical protein